MSVPPGFHLGHRDGRGASFYIQVCHLCSNKLLDELESTWPSIISLQQNSITMALIAGQNVSDGEHFLGGWGEKKKRSLTYTPARLILLASFLFLQSTKLFPTPAPLLTLFPSPGTLPPPTTWGSHVIRQTLAQGFASSSLSIGTNPPPHHISVYFLHNIWHSKCNYIFSFFTYSLLVPQLLWESLTRESRCVPSLVHHCVYLLYLAQHLVPGVGSINLHSVHECMRKGPRQGSQRKAPGECCWLGWVANLVALLSAPMSYQPPLWWVQLRPFVCRLGPVSTGDEGPLTIKNAS